ncbi:RNase A-like domain-containing protein [Streptomyces cyaneofuscatus]|uniref:RNase A-like domain-containing protein n=1 Tax=Streptomyces cyaneofuscatus TaxID=66883 RepID=UPI0004C9D4C7|nr:RNase A-like domain-containing protein [Streptomyces cyaneofuscatus]
MTDLPSGKQRQRERDQARTAPPNQGVGSFDVQPKHLYFTSLVVRDAQFAYDEKAKRLTDTLDKYSQSAGTGWGADSFADRYGIVAGKFLELWAKSVVSVGGVAVGFTQTANNYAQADWAARKGKGEPPEEKQPPAVIATVPKYGPPNDLTWRGEGEYHHSWAASGILGEIPDFLMFIMKPVVDEGLRLGRIHEKTPGVEEEEFRDIARAWREASKDAKKAADDFTDAISYITDPTGNGEWQAAMRAFCQTIWGTTAWGKARDGRAEVTAKKGTRNWKTHGKMDPATRRPIIEILDKSANVMQGLFDDLADMGQKTTETTTRLAKEAADKTVKSLTSDLDLSKLTRLAAGLMFAEVVLTFRSHMDKAAMDAAVEAYHEAFSDAAGKLAMLEFELDEALLSVPTFQAERARAQGFGARSLNEFKKEHSWQLPESQFPYRYSVDLAAAEGVGNGHTLDKHVGKTDAQLLQRMRDESKADGTPKIPGASTYADMESAQRLTQYALRDNTEEITRWLNENPPRPIAEFDTASVPQQGPLVGEAITGRGTTLVDGKVTEVRDMKGVSLRLMYEPGLNPPYVVFTSMPK